MKKILLLIALLLIVYGCRSEPSDEWINQVTDAPNAYSIEDFKKLGLKIGEEYDH